MGPRAFGGMPMRGIPMRLALGARRVWPPHAKAQDGVARPWWGPQRMERRHSAGASLGRGGQAGPSRPNVATYEEMRRMLAGGRRPAAVHV